MLGALSLPTHALTDEPRWLHGLVSAVCVLNLFDLVLTLGSVSAGRATEVNPLMAQLLAAHPLWFAIVKLALVSAGVMLLWVFRSRTAAVVAIVVAFAAYYGVWVHHLVGAWATW
jgi:hypothetical protein